MPFRNFDLDHRTPRKKGARNSRFKSSILSFKGAFLFFTEEEKGAESSHRSLI